MALENAAQFWDLEGKIRRGRGREAGTATIHRCADGYIALVAIMGKNKVMWDPFVNWMAKEGVEDWQVFNDAKWIDPAYRSSAEGYAAFCKIFERYTAKHPKFYLYEIGQKYKVAVTPVSNGRDLLENPQLRHRNYWQSVPNNAAGGMVTYPGAPYQFGELQWQLGGNAPHIGQHSAEVLGELGYTAADIAAFKKAGTIHAG
jgi:benzylsuccinate CoA-transferase BbsE subunit/naphthyl-2-methylsuccinate CoA transferase subunit